MSIQIKSSGYNSGTFYLLVWFERELKHIDYRKRFKPISVGINVQLTISCGNRSDRH